MHKEKDHDLTRGFPPSSMAFSGGGISAPPVTQREGENPNSEAFAWSDQGRRWNGFDSWSAKVNDYLKSGFVAPKVVVGFSQTVPHFENFAGHTKDELNLFDDGEMTVYVGQLYNVADLAAAYERLRRETAFVVPASAMVIDPRVTGKAFLAIEKIDCTDGSSLEYQITGANADDCLNLVSEIRELLSQAKEVLQHEFFVNLDNPDNWGLTSEGIARARARWPLTQSDLVILRPIV
jgi:hypothetical protein